MQAVDLQQTIEEALVATQQLVAESDIELNKHMSSESLEVMVDKDKMIQVVINLISNAVKFCDTDNGVIDVSISQDKGMAFVEVIDNGSGIPVGEEIRIFEKFHQVSDAQDGKPRGTGLGLPICRRIVEHHGGRIWAENSPDQGAKLVFTLPIRNVGDQAKAVSNS